MKHVTCFPLSDIPTSSGQRLASVTMSRTAVSLCCAVVKENGVHNKFVNQLDDDELRNGYFQQDGATCHTSNESMSEIESFFDDRIISKALWPPRSPDLSPPDFFPVGRLQKKKLMPTSHAPYRNWKTTFDVKLLRLVRTSCRPLSQT